MSILPRPESATIIDFPRQPMEAQTPSKHGGKREPLPRFTVTIPNYSRYQAMAINPIELLNTLTLYLAPHAFSAAQINTMAQMLASIPNDEVGLKKRVYTAVLLIMCVPEYLIQR
jgi:hypothetical protein